MPIEKITADSPEVRSADVVQENLDRLREIFPEAFTEGGVDFDVLRQLLGDEVDDGEEKFGLNWRGKRRARKLALTPSTGTLRPVPEDSVDWDTTQNLLVEGDNLEVLKLFQKSYASRFDLIFIDPPYNTGGDFVYRDDFRDPLRGYLESTGQLEDGDLATSRPEGSGRFHTSWLNMMYPRLKRAHALLKPTGVMAITIDDGEHPHLRAIMNEIFGEENFICNVVWQKAYVANMTAKHVSSTHDHLVVYARNHDRAVVGRIPRTKEQVAKFTNPDGDPRGPWKAENLSSGKFYGAGRFEITTPSGETVSPPPGRYWRCNEERFRAWVTEGRIWFGADGSGRPMLKKYLSEVEEGLTPDTWWTHKDVGSNKQATIDLKRLFDGQHVFDSPKPVSLLSRLIHLFVPVDGSVLDFFAGSGTTGHAVLEANAADGGRRRFVLVQLQEALDPNDRRQEAAVDLCDRMGVSRTIVELTKERLRRAASTISGRQGSSGNDRGFRVLRLDSANIRPWDPDRENLEQTLLDHEEHIRPDRSEADVLYEVLLKLGLDLCVPMETQEAGGLTIRSIGGGVLFACLAPYMNDAEAEAVATAIGEWRQELAPAGDSTAIFRDSAFESDVAKANLVAMLEQAGIAKVRSL